MTRAAILLSIKPWWATSILSGTKVFEYRRTFPRPEPGTAVILYSSSPRKAIVGFAFVVSTLIGTPDEIWSATSGSGGVTQTQFEEYYRGADSAIAIRLSGAIELDEPIPLSDLRQRWPNFRPPQSFRYIEFDHDGTQVAVKLDSAHWPPIILPFEQA